MMPRSAVGETELVDDVDQLASAVMLFVRNFGLLHPDRTPCGQSLSVSQAHALAEIHGRPGITQRDLADALGLARATISEVVSSLIDRGWVERAQSAEDRRQRCLTLSLSGKNVASEVAQSRRALISEIIDTIDPDQRAHVVDATQLLAEAARQRRTKE